MQHRVDGPADCRTSSLAGRPGSRYGARLMFSMPPATITWASPQRMAWSASITACSPEPHTLLIVSAATVGGKPAAERRLPSRRLAHAGRQARCP